MIRRIASLSLAALLAGPALATPPELFATYCASCHGDDRLGAIGPALIPETLGRMRGPDLAGVIAAGRPATQMPGFAAMLDPAEIAGLAEWLKTPLAAVPPWGERGDRRLARARSRTTAPPRRRCSTPTR